MVIAVDFFYNYLFGTEHTARKVLKNKGNLFWHEIRLFAFN